VPVPAGSTNKTYELAFDEAVIPALRAFKPELILVAAGA
jgi:acetoin utilization deacetylase AcuC-like enzyme